MKITASEFVIVAINDSYNDVARFRMLRKSYEAIDCFIDTFDLDLIVKIADNDEIETVLDE